MGGIGGEKAQKTKRFSVGTRGKKSPQKRGRNEGKRRQKEGKFRAKRELNESEKRALYGGARGGKCEVKKAFLKKFGKALEKVRLLC